MQTKNHVQEHDPEAKNAGGDDVSLIAHALFDKVKSIKRAHPEISRKIDANEKHIRECLVTIRNEINKMEKRDKDLVTILVINGIHRTTEEVLIHE
ncbi:MAG: hypothetical protein A2Z34_06160 [Planctomycetes bacterium RBG_16_59_8]|nr:MAG: hypothetical protein A2Z34_06160 [Planctomycetes bacterium RBG_16_59_8]